MARTLEEVRQVVMELSEEDRQALAEEIIESRWSPRWRETWEAEVERRLKRVETGEDRVLTPEEFWSDDDVD